MRFPRAPIAYAVALLTLGFVSAAQASIPVQLRGDAWTVTLTGLPEGWSRSASNPDRLSFDSFLLPGAANPWGVAAAFGEGTVRGGLVPADRWVQYTINAADGYLLQSWQMSAAGYWGAEDVSQVSDSFLKAKLGTSTGLEARTYRYTFTDPIGGIGGRWSVMTDRNEISGTTFTGWFKLSNLASGPLSAIGGSADGGPQFSVAVTPVPEPHEWVMMLAGLGMVGWAARRRKGVGALPAAA